jgi:membrane dipeptidase
MSIYVPSSMQLDGDPKAYADSLINMVHHIIAAHPDKFAKGESPDEIEANFKKGLLSLPLGMENGAPIREIADLAYFFNRGIRYITLTHATDNQICDSSYDTSRTWNGLSQFGRSVVEQMNRQGIMIDISHVTDAAFYQVIGLTRAPVIASHSSCRMFTPDFQRNMSDDMIKTLGKNGGIIMINFGSDFLDSRVTKTREEVRTKWMNALAEKNLQEGDPEAAPIVAAFKQEYHTQLFSDVEMVADHIDHAVKLAGVNHVGLGSDFDGVGDSLPLGLKDVAAFPNLIEVLLRRGYSEKDIEKICWNNLARVWREVERVAAEMR